MDFVRLNLKQLKIEREAEIENSLKNRRKRPLGHRTKKLREPSAIERSRITNKIKNNKELSERERKLLDLYGEDLLKKQYFEEIKINESVFLSSARKIRAKDPIQAQKRISELKTKFNLSEPQYKNLIAQGYVKEKAYHSSNELEEYTPADWKNAQENNVVSVYDGKVEQIIKTLNSVESSKNLNREELLKAFSKSKITPRDFRKLEFQGVVDCLTKEEMSILSQLKGKTIISKDYLSSKYADRLVTQKKITPEGVNLDVLPKKLHEIALRYLEGEEKLSEMVGEKEAKLIQSATDYISNLFVVDVDINAKVNIENILNYAPEIYLSDSPEIIKERMLFEDLPLPGELEIAEKRVINRISFKKELNAKEKLISVYLKEGRGYEKYILSNSELMLLRKISKRQDLKKCTLNSFIKIAQEDFGIKLERASELIDLGFLQVNREDGVRTNYYENMSDLKERANFPEIIKNNDVVRIQYMDYKVLEKILMERPLTFSEQVRVLELALFNVDAYSKKFQSERLSPSASQKIHGWQNSLLLNLYQARHGVNRSLLKFINKFKQVSYGSMKSMGISDDELDRMENGIKGDELFDKTRLIQRYKIRTREGAIHFFSINHKGQVSGRKFLLQELEKEQIAKRPQARKNLIPHDLKVVDCVIEVIKELRQKKKNVIEIKNESIQMSEQKKGLQIHERGDTPAFMDALLIVEDLELDHTGGSSSGGGSSVIAVEYGNYDVAIMGKKIENSEFDHAYIYANESYTEKYKEAFKHIKNVTFRVL